MSKSSTTVAADETAKPVVSTPVRPRTLNIALILMLAAVLLSILAAVSWFGHDQQLIKVITDSHHKLKPKESYSAAQAMHDLKSERKSVLIQTVVIDLAILFLAFALTKVRSANAGRWGFLIITVMTALGSVFPYTGVPVIMNIGRVGQGVCELAALVLLFLPDSRRYFRECKGNILGAAGIENRPKLRDLLAPGAARARQNAATTATPPAANQSSGVTLTKGRAKTRTDAAVAKGAELARQRAKASKSRRTDPPR